MTKQELSTDDTLPTRDNGMPTIRFLLIFSGAYIIFHILYFMVPNDVLGDIVYHKGIVSIAVNIINYCAPLEATQAIANKLVSTKASLEVVRGCDGAGATFLLIAAILAFSAPWKDKLTGVVISLALMLIINQARIIGLYFIVAYKRDWFQLVHTYLAPTFIIIISCLFFMWWAVRSRSSGVTNGQPRSA